MINFNHPNHDYHPDHDNDQLTNGENRSEDCGVVDSGTIPTTMAELELALTCIIIIIVVMIQGHHDDHLDDNESL